MSMKCKECGAKTTAFDSRQREGYVYRRYRCLGCERRFSTVEREHEFIRGEEVALDHAATLDSLSQMLAEASEAVSRVNSSIFKREAQPNQNSERP